MTSLAGSPDTRSERLALRAQAAADGACPAAPATSACGQRGGSATDGLAGRNTLRHVTRPRMARGPWANRRALAQADPFWPKVLA